MKNLNGLLIVFSIILLQSCFYKQYNPATREYETVGEIPILRGVRKNKRHLYTYPPAGLTEGLKNYYSRFNQFPRSLADLSGYSLESARAIEQMFQTNYDNIEIAYSSKDSLIINYKYNAMTREEMAKSKNNIYSLCYKGQYVFTKGNDGILIENKISKRRF